MRKKHTRLSKAGRKIVAGLREIAETHESGQPLNQHFAVRHVTVRDGGRRAPSK